ncbi:hypothetical protein [Kordia sp.]|uniref:hypothetical protein n=1 Tax=Kordia sp. TaxID=1965332 RepID=UPI003D6AC332
MKKQILSIGKALSKTEQKAINGGAVSPGPLVPCEEPQLAPPPEGCYYRRIRPCTYILICNDIFAI